MSQNNPTLGEINILQLKTTLQGLEPKIANIPLGVSMVGYHDGFITARNLAIESVERMWNAAQLLHAVQLQEDEPTMDERAEIAYTLRLIARTIDPR